MTNTTDVRINSWQKRRNLSGACFLALLIMLICLKSSTATANNTDNSVLLRVGAYDNHPKVFTDNEGNVTGLFPEILSDIAEKEGWQLKYIHGTWTQCLERLRNNEIDIMVDVAFSEERKKLYDFTNETVLVNWGVIYTTPDFALESLLDLKGKNVAVMKGSIHTDGRGGIKNLAEKFDIECNFIEVNNYTQVFDLLQNKDVDAGIVNRIFGALFEDDYDVVKSPVVFNPRQLRFAFSKDSPLANNIGNAIDRHIRQMKVDPHSTLHKSIEVYLYGMPREWIDKDRTREKIFLTDNEKAWIREHPVIRLGFDPEFVPFEFLAEDGTYSGIASDYVDILRERLGLNIEVVFGLGWKEVVDQIKNRQIDILPCVGMTEERKTFLNYSEPYIDFYRVIIMRTDKPFISGIDDVYDRKIGVQVNTSHEGYIKEKTDIKPILYKDLQSSLLAVSDGKIDALIANVASATYWIRKMNLTNLKVAAAISEKESLYFAVRKDWPELIKIINKGLASITEQEKNAIRRRRVTVDYEPGIDIVYIRRIALRIAAVLAVIFVVFIIWNRTLKKEINDRIAAENTLKEYTDKLAEANIRLKDLDRLKSMFIASMSHELRTPLNSIIGFSTILLNEWAGTINDEQKENLSTIVRSGKYLLSLINDVIDVSKIESGKIDIHLEEFDLDDVISESLEMFSKDIEEKGLQLKVDSIHTNIYTDRRRLLQSIVNFISNAIKYTEKGTISVQAKLLDETDIKIHDLPEQDDKMQITGQWVKISVTDTGIGIKEDDMQKLFMAFQRIELPSHLKVGGTGLGLYLTKKIITELLHGQVNASSKYGSGSTFRLLIPCSVKMVMVREKVL